MIVHVLGAGGAVGHAAVRALTGPTAAPATVRALGRRPERLRELGTELLTGVDLSAVDAWPEAAWECDVLLNCAGPSGAVSAAPAREAARRGIHWVDAGGDAELLDSLSATVSTGRSAMLLGAGVQPGLTVVALRWAAQAAPAGRLLGLAGGLQRLTPAGLAEYVAAATRGTGSTGTRWVRGTTHAAAPVPLPADWPDSATTSRHLDPETLAWLAEDGNALTLDWANVTDSPALVSALSRVLSGEADRTDVATAAELDLFGREPWFAVEVRAQAEESAETARRVIVRCRDSYALTGCIAASAARRVTEIDAGSAAWWSGSAAPEDLLADVARSGAAVGATVHLLDARTPVEEGTL